MKIAHLPGGESRGNGAASRVNRKNPTIVVVVLIVALIVALIEILIAVLIAADKAALKRGEVFSTLRPSHFDLVAAT